MQKIARGFKQLAREGRAAKANEDGQIIVFTALSGLVLALMVATIFNVGMVIGEKMKVQNTADAAAYSQAVWEARTLNILAYTNRAILSHMVTIAFATAIFSQEKLWRKIRNMSAAVLAAAAAVATIPFAQGAAAFVAYVAGGINRVATFLWGIWNWLIRMNIPQTVRKAALSWIKACQNVFQDPLMSDFARQTAAGKIPKKVAGLIDPDVEINQGAGMIANGLTVRSLAALTGISRARMDFNSLKKTYEESMDGFSRGTSFPREIDFGGKWMQIEFGLRGDVQVYPDSLVQRDGFFLRIGYGPKPVWYNPARWGWHFDKSYLNFARAKYDGLRLRNMKMWNVRRDSEGKIPFPSVYTVAQKSSKDILQINLLKAATGRDITAFSRAEVFYWDPAQKDRPKGPARAPNLFNPFWHARLAAADGELDSLIGFLRDYVPITH